MVISDAVKELRKALGESQQAFAGRLGLYISSVAHYEGGQREPDYLVVMKLYRVRVKPAARTLPRFFSSSSTRA